MWLAFAAIFVKDESGLLEVYETPTLTKNNSTNSCAYTLIDIERKPYCQHVIT